MMNDRLPLLLIPGLLCTARLWEHQTSTLTDVAVPSVIDHRHHKTVGDLARHILKNAPPRFALAGLSMGGYTAMEIFRQAPDRVDRIAFLDTSYKADRPEQSEGRRDAMERAQKMGIAEVHASLVTGWVAPERLKDTAFMADALEMAEETGVEGFINQQQVIMSRPDSTETLRQIGCPALVLVGALDTLTPVELHEEMADIIPGAVLEIIDGCGHLSAMESPKAVSDCLRTWLNR